MTESPRGVVSITTTKRRRFLWCAWWTGEPTRDPFRKPDAFSGGARSAAEALAEAQRAAGGPLRQVEPIWARAFVRVLAGQPPWVEKKARARPEEREPEEEKKKRRRYVPSVSSPERCPFAVLGLPKTASVEEIRRAFRQKALATHPDRGGDAEAFIQVTWARDEALARRMRGS
ncbi:J domain-containing protein [Polyangium aurulentum]|uniref:J domain-containing protein n=1 Tax=Polyangium aurulentum TaxID=2567896 RepID=UPI0010ADD651|nr:J domain-containing protein [Polyangium aurulentum]UQA57571.1 J domain-containing protein [Polyangium aurulentum]